MKPLMQSTGIALVLGAIAMSSIAHAGSNLASLQYGYVPGVGTQNNTVSQAYIASQKTQTTIAKTISQGNNVSQAYIASQQTQTAAGRTASQGNIVSQAYVASLQTQTAAGKTISQVNIAPPVTVTLSQPNSKTIVTTAAGIMANTTGTIAVPNIAASTPKGTLVIPVNPNINPNKNPAQSSNYYAMFGNTSAEGALDPTKPSADPAPPVPPINPTNPGTGNPNGQPGNPGNGRYPNTPGGDANKTADDALGPLQSTVNSIITNPATPYVLNTFGTYVTISNGVNSFMDHVDNFFDSIAPGPITPYFGAPQYGAATMGGATTVTGASATGAAIFLVP